MRKQTPFLITGAILVAAVVTVTLYNADIANAQSSNMTKTTNMTSPNMTKTTNMTAAGGNMTRSELKSYSECLRSECELF
jgi:hypothetical protein